MGLSIVSLTICIAFSQKYFACKDLGDKIRFVNKICCTHTTIPTVLRLAYSSSLGSDLASQCLAYSVIDKEKLDIAHKLLTLGCASDVTSGRLKLAAFYLIQDNFVMAEHVLHRIHENYTYLVSHCRSTPTEEALFKILENNLSAAEFVRQYVAFPVLYFQSEIHCMPQALILNMFVSSRPRLLNHGPSQCVYVDPQFFLHYLEYQCYFRQGRTSHKMAALDNMLWVVYYTNLEYRDSAFSLLACCLMQEEMYINAWKVLCKSMRLQNENNAAMWQIAFLIKYAFRFLRMRQ
ncbi:hypothetical protein ACJMK2_014512 [Sinanodonta woodiana]|uniref:Uncharacterized protein n=1 Tax=Sinanodonta woodiana TaxID=1069815 RepID=A0ABD3V258_SINWO